MKQSIILVLFCIIFQNDFSLAEFQLDARKWSKNENLANKIEQILNLKGNLRIDHAKEELTKQLEKNVIKNLAANVLVQRPIEQNQEIFKLMRKTLNGDLDFSPAVEKIPFLLRRQDKTDRLQIILNSIRVKENGGQISEIIPELRQQQNATTPKPSQLDKIVDAASKINIRELSTFLKEIPEIFEGIQTIVDSVDDIFG